MRLIGNKRLSEVLWDFYIEAQGLLTTDQALEYRELFSAADEMEKDLVDAESAEERYEDLEEEHRALLTERVEVRTAFYKGVGALLPDRVRIDKADGGGEFRAIPPELDEEIIDEIFNDLEKERAAFTTCRELLTEVWRTVDVGSVGIATARENYIKWKNEG